MTNNPQLLFFDLGDWQPTRDTLHAYSRVIAALPRAYIPPHPLWWHISLTVDATGLSTKPVALPGGGALSLHLNFRDHTVVLTTTDGTRHAWSMQAGLSDKALADLILAAAAGLGLEGPVDRSKFESDAPRPYAPEEAARYFAALSQIERLMQAHRATFPGSPGPVQLWPHGFDISFEWFGSRRVVLEEGGISKEYPAQLNFGWSTGDAGHPGPYFYSNPWPFEADRLIDHPLPAGSSWYTQSWKGTIFPYAELVGDPAAAERLLAYARRVFEIAEPVLR